MMKLITRAFEVYRTQGLKRLLNLSTIFIIKNSLGKVLPAKKRLLNGVSVRDSFWGQPGFLGGVDQPNYEEGLCESIREHVVADDIVLIIGGGKGVSSVIAAKQATNSGKVFVFEGNPEQAEKIVETARLNDVHDIISIFSEIVEVEEAHLILGSESNKYRPITELPEHDVLVLDCEGAESNILREMHLDARVIIVETHGLFNSQPGAIKCVLKNNGYRIVGKEVAEPSREVFCRQNGVFIIQAVQD